MANQYVGFLPYGSDDETVVCASAMTSLAQFTEDIETTAGGTLTAMPGVSDNSGFDPVLGMLSEGPDGDGSGGYSIVGCTNQDKLQNGGQLTMEVQSSFFTVVQPDYGSEGDDHSARTGSQAPFLFGIKSPAVKFSGIACLESGAWKCPVIAQDGSPIVSEQTSYYNRYINASPASAYCLSQSYGDYIKLNVYWVRSGVQLIWYLALDGEIIITNTTTSVAAIENLFATMFINTLIGTNTYSNWTAYIRNFQISYRVPSFGRVEAVGRTVFWTDSLGQPGDQHDWRNGLGSASLSGFGSAHIASSYVRAFNNAEKGVLAGDIWVRGDGGFGLINGTGQMSSTIDVMLAKNPDVVVLEIGTNDAVDVSVSAWQTELESIITGLKAGNVRTIVLCTIPSYHYLVSRRTAPWVAQNAALNAVINTVAAADENICVADLYTKFEAAGKNCWIGGFQDDDVTGNLHWHTLGHETAGREVCRALKQHVGA